MLCASGSDDSDEEIAKARELLSWRPGYQHRSLPSKGGPKFFGNTGAALEENKVDTQLKTYKAVLESKKVRKISNLGKAEWNADMGVAIITKQGKFMQTMGHHNGEHFALRAEEALFLTDIGDIELVFNDVPLSLQEAFSIILTNEKGDCSFDEYIVFSNLVKRGYIVRRFGEKISTKKDKKKKSAAKRRNAEDTVAQTSKGIKLDVEVNGNESDMIVDDVPATEHGTVVQGSKDGDIIKTCNSRTDVDIDATHANGFQNGVIQKANREWFFEDARQNNKEDILSEVVTVLSEFDFPNLADTSCTCLKAPPHYLVPAGVPSKEFSIEEKWRQRLKRDPGKLNSLPSRTINYAEAARKAMNWSHYKELLLVAKHKRGGYLEAIYEKLSSDGVRPLLHPLGVFSVKDIVDRLHVTQEVLADSKRNFAASEIVQLKYNVYQSGSTPFKKTNPGKPHCRVTVMKAQDKTPDVATVLSLLQQSKGVPVKFAVVDNGQVSYYGYDEGTLPVII